VLANMAAAIDIVSNGRLELGLGAGWNEEESGAYGIELGSPRERSDRFEEACQVIIGLLSQETTTFDGTYYRLTDARNEPKGPQRPHPPICIGGNGEKRTLRTTARYAQHWNFLGGPVEEFARKRDVLHAHCADVGRDPRDHPVQPRPARSRRRGRAGSGDRRRTRRGGARPGDLHVAAAARPRRPHPAGGRAGTALLSASG
jgi:alkanesulfonate monooxygenase SsuD/methylene tetrahydromethanopterin reductase-like flavin-dependent oxidoreductase (luciferase family)